MIATILSPTIQEVIGAAMLITMYGWLMLLPFIGFFHLCFWTYRWVKRAGTPKPYIKRLQIYISLVLLYALGALVIYVLQYVDPRPYRYVTVWAVYLTLVPTFFPFYYWIGIFRYARKMKISL